MPVDPANSQALLELLRQKGVLADQRNLRLAPFPASTGNDAGAASATGVPPQSNVADAALSNDPTAGAPPPIDNGDGTFTDPVNGNVVDAQTAQSMWPAFFAGASGAAMGYAASELLKRKGIPTVEGETIDPTIGGRVSSDPPIVDGEYTDVRDEPNARSAISSASADVQASSKPSAASVLADRQRRLTGPKPALTKQPGKYADVSPEEMQRANAIADELVKQRLVGNANPKLAAKRGASTGPMNRQSLLESVIAAIRKAKINPNTVARAIP